MKHYSKTEIEEVGALIQAAELRPKTAERPFGLHPALFIATIGGYFAFIGVMMIAFGAPEMAVPFAVCLAYIAMAFGTPALWGKIQPRGEGRYQSWGEFRAFGLDTATGRISSGGAIAQVLVLPVLLLGFAVAIAAIVLLV